ncbi:unnamed protein product [Orchesella dallaii]|uniref:LITAF domain-containing protein n=1 Tax=Orchesella dallaii TaxID=48710 RepID=A0ABP1RYV6_9HEXA
MSAPPPYNPEYSSNHPPPSVYPSLHDTEMTEVPPPAGFVQPAHPIVQQPQQTVVVVASTFGPHSTQVTCPHCGTQCQTKTEKNPSIVAYISTVAICCLGGWLGCCLIPLCIDACMDTQHGCPNCGAQLGTYRAF